MPKIKRTKHDINRGKEEDIQIKSGRFRLYFQNRYTLISLTTDLLTGLFYVIASISSLTPIPDVYGKYLYLIGGIFLTTRPIIKIFHNIFIYDDKKIAEQMEKKDKEKDDQEYNEDYYGKDNDKEYEKEEAQQENKEKNKDTDLY